MKANAIALAVLACAPVLLPASAMAAAASPRPCTSVQSHQFDFWLGSWELFDARGKAQGRDDVTREYGGCVIQEHWRSAGEGQRGSSFTYYDPASKSWHQSWVDSTGGFLQIDGVASGKGLVLRGTMPDVKYGHVTHVITWTPSGSDRVRYFWRQSYDGGRSWKTVLDGYFKRLPK